MGLGILRRPFAAVAHALPRGWDGHGYPDGLAGEDIPLGARIVAVCDAYDAMITDCPYRKALPVKDALAELERCSGSQFDPSVVAASVAVIADRRLSAMADA